MLNKVTIQGTLLALCMMLSAGAHAIADTPKQVDIPAGELSTALLKLSRQYGADLVYRPEQVYGLKTHGAHGSLTTEQAATQLLQGTPLELRSDPSGAMLIAPVSIGSVKGAASTGGTNPARDTIADSKGAGKSSSQGFRVAQVDQGKNSNPSSVANLASTSQESSNVPSAGLTEIIVTAQKREERLQNVPMSVTALSGKDLENTQSRRFEDYVGDVPGLLLVDDHSYGSQLVIRGISSGSYAINTTVATYLDETPFMLIGTTGGSLYGTPDLDPFDMQRIEVLKGPQGTLYGANALGGILKYVTNAPDPTAFSGAVESGISSVSNGGVGFDVHGMVNLPLSDKAALRLVGYDNDYPGFIDDPSRGATDINSIRYSGGRAAFLYQVTDDLTVRMNALYQHREWGDTSDVDVNPGTLAPIHGPLTQENLIARPGYSATELYNLTTDWNPGPARLLSSTSYFATDVDIRTDASKQLQPALNFIFGVPYGATIGSINPIRAITQEFRLSSAESSRLEWQLGAFYADEWATVSEPIYPIDPSTRQILYDFAPSLGQFYLNSGYVEYAGFANLDFHITNTVDVAAGARYSTNNQHFHDIGTGLFGGGADFETRSSEGVSTYSGDLRWKFDPHAMLYARIATGFVPGGPNISNPVNTGESSYESSTTVDYELGVKSSFMNEHVLLNASAFRINWQRIQLTGLTSDNFSLVENGTTARSDGAEFSLTVAPIEHLQIGLNGAYTDAYLTGPAPAYVNAQVGARLPQVPLWQLSARAEYDWPLWDTYSGTAGVNWRFTGDRYADFVSSGPRPLIPRTNIVDLRAGIRHEKWSLEGYVKNVGNATSINDLEAETLAGGSGPLAANMYPPRTMGASVTVRF